jgi:ABC-2 type transport system permease protein
MQAVSRALPPSYVFEGMRAAVAGRGLAPATLAVGVALAVAYVGAACWFFTLIYRHAVRSGLVARYSAETVT